MLGNFYLRLEMFKESWSQNWNCYNLYIVTTHIIEHSLPHRHNYKYTMKRSDFFNSMEGLGRRLGPQ